jgi:diacylglycerol O-acyltransferase
MTTTSGTPRDVDVDGRMSEHEALMWNIEKDPWLNPNGASLSVLDRPVDIQLFRRQIRVAVATMPRLHQRVVPGFARISTPAWAPDPEFDLDYHLREVELPAAGDDRALFDLAARLYAEPLDRTRPLWRFVSISGLDGGRGAVYSMIHHVVSDGIGQLRMAEMYQQLTRDDPGPDDVDLERIVADAVASHRSKEAGGDRSPNVGETLRLSVEHLARRQLGIGRSIAAEMAMWPADPDRIGERVSAVGDLVKTVVDQLQPSNSDEHSGSPLWTARSRHRRLEHVRVAVDDLKAIGRPSGASVNEVFMAGLAEGAYRYHAKRKADVTAFHSSFVLSTRTDGKAGGNAFTPVPVKLPGSAMTPSERLAGTGEAVAVARDRTNSSGGIGALSGVVNLLPTSVVTRAARAAASRIDFATSNLRGAPFELYCAGAKVEATICMGPVAGTAANITALSHDGNFDMGIFVDPEAIEDPADFGACVAAAFEDMASEVSTSGTASEVSKSKPKKAKKPKKVD